MSQFCQSATPPAINRPIAAATRKIGLVSTANAPFNAQVAAACAVVIAVPAASAVALTASIPANTVDAIDAATVAA